MRVRAQQRDSPSPSRRRRTMWTIGANTTAADSGRKEGRMEPQRTPYTSMEQYTREAVPEKEILRAARRRAAANPHPRPLATPCAPRQLGDEGDAAFLCRDKCARAPDDDAALNEKLFVLHKKPCSLEHCQMTWDRVSGGATSSPRRFLSISLPFFSRPTITLKHELGLWKPKNGTPDMNLAVGLRTWSAAIPHAVDEAWPCCLAHRTRCRHG